MQVPRAGSYVVTTGPPAIANPDGLVLDIGHSPALGDLQIWERVGVVWLIVFGLWLVGHVVVARMASGNRRSGEAVFAADATHDASASAGPTPRPAHAADAPTFASRTPGASRPPPAHVDRLERLAALHERGELTDAEFAAEKARLLAQG